MFLASSASLTSLAFSCKIGGCPIDDRHGSEPMGEKRRHRRQAADIAIFYCTQRQDGEAPRRIYYPGTILDRCAGGLGLLVSYPHETDEVLWFEGFRDEHSQVVLGRVRWMRPEDGGYRLGVELQE